MTRTRVRAIASAAVVSGALSLTGLAATAQPAQAAGTCSEHYVCMWEDTNYSGSRYVRQYKTSGYYGIHYWDGDNEISSVKNYTGKCVRLYANDDHSGDSYLIHKDVREISDLKENDFNDEAESYRIYSC
jgi:hypothetical protein